MAKGSRGGKRGGTGGVTAGDILNTSNLLIDTELDEVTRGEVTRVLKDFQKEFGLNYNNTRIAELKPNSNALAYYDYEGIAINKKYLNSKVMNDTYQKCVESGFHPPSGSKSGMEAVVSHELGHALNDMIAKKLKLSLDEAATRIVSDATISTDHKNMTSLTAKISGYAKKSHAEAVAEAVADVYCNGKKARTESREIVNFMNDYLKH